jgi:hypothetical protein
VQLRRGMTVVAAMALTCGAAGAAHAQNPQGYYEEWKEPAPTRSPKAGCGDLRSLTGYDYSIDAATVVPPRGQTPEFCHVQGLVAPEVRFEVALPRAWNGRLYMFGNGGFAGESFTAPGRVTRRDAALVRGFAVVSTNTGHDASREPGASFALSPQKLSDYAYRAVHVSAVTAKELAARYYGSAPARAYFDGCSTGGRQGLIAAQRFPEDFDGIIVGAPVLDFSGTMLHYLRFHQAARSAPALHTKLAALAAAVTGKCDAADGRADGIIDDPRACRFDPAADMPHCAADGAASGAGSGCLTDGEVSALRAFYGDLSAGGQVRFPGFPVGAEAALDPWFATDGQTISRRFMETFFQYMVTPGREIDWTTFDIEKSIDQLRSISTLLDATDPDLGRFRDRGGKILMYYGWADQALNPRMGLDYFERMRATMGERTADFFRLFMMPGVYHCTGGPGPDRADFITALVRWVEQGAAPERIVASKREKDAVVRTRPLCSYPKAAAYTGTGPAEDQQSYECR